jgi:DNA-binding MarR family transcriptional regulator
MQASVTAMPRPSPALSTDQDGQLTERSLSFLVRRAHRAFVAMLAAALLPHEVSVAEWAVLRILWRQEGLTQVALATRLAVGKASLTPVLNGLERKGILSRTRTEGDRRKHALCLTAHGRELEARLLPLGAAINRQARSGIKDEDFEIAAQVLERVIGNLQPDEQ